MTDAYSKLLTTHDPKNPKAMCGDQYFNQNRVNVVTNLITASIGMWQSANCDDCYNNSTSMDHQLSNNTIAFNEYHDSFHKCVDETKTNQTNACVVCAKPYSMLNALYEAAFVRSKPNTICFDVEDKVR